jgi:hypothetical protein
VLVLLVIWGQFLTLYTQARCAADTPGAAFPPRRHTLSAMDHGVRDRISMEMASRIAAGLADHPEWLALARDNLDRWSARNSGSPGLVRCYAEWRKILSRPIAEVCDALVEPGDEGQRLRQNSPFVGILAPAEVWEIKRRHEATGT